jgi:hypothetical protein
MEDPIEIEKQREHKINKKMMETNRSNQVESNYDPTVAEWGRAAISTPHALNHSKSSR